MNEFRSPDYTIPAILPRAAAAVLVSSLATFPVVVVTGGAADGQEHTGADAAGAGGRPYLTLDDPELRDQARRDPGSVLARADALVLDEVQRAPDVLSRNASVPIGCRFASRARHCPGIASTRQSAPAS